MKAQATILALALISTAHAGGIHKCVDQNGHIEYRATPCVGELEYARGSQTATFSGYNPGIRQGEVAELARIRSRERYDRVEKSIARDLDRRKHVGYADRKRLRELEMKERRVADDIKKLGEWEWGKAYAGSRQIDAISRERSQINDPRY